MRDGEDREELVSKKSSREAIGRDGDTKFEFGAKVSEECSKDLPVGEEGHNPGLETACGTPHLATNADHISRKILEGNALISSERNFPGMSLWVDPVASIITFNLVEAI